MEKVDKAFLKAGQKSGLETWRIEKMKVVPQDPTTNGEFYTGDSYIILHTKKNPSSEKLEWNIHFWLGYETSQDEKGVAAYKTVELDDYLGGAPVQYREVQEHESKLFLSYFPKGIRYLTGGIESGFRKVARGKYEKRLFQIKGKKNVRVKQVELSCRSLNQGDVFILDCGQTIHLWNGPQSSTFERMKGHQVAKHIRDEERGGKAEIRIIDIRWNSDTRFFADLGSKTDIAESSTAGDDTEFERKLYSEIKLYSVSDASGKMEVIEKSKKPFEQTDLDSNDCFILDAGSSGIFVWVGRKCTHAEKACAWKYATDFLDLKGYPEWTSVTRIVEGGETPVFKEYFVSWSDNNDQKGLGKMYNVGSIAEIKEEIPIDYDRLHDRKQSMDEETVNLEVFVIKRWKIEDGDAKYEAENSFSVFSAASCYVVMSSLAINGHRRTCAYYWQGTCSTVDDKAASAIYTTQICEQEGDGAPEQILVLQGKEPDIFLKIFKGQMIIVMNGNTCITAFQRRVTVVIPFQNDNTCKNDQWTKKSKIMFHIRGTSIENTKAVEVQFTSKSLNSYDVFLIKIKERSFVWIGKASFKFEVQAAQNLASHLAPNSSATSIQESKETEEFWKLIGGKEAYAKCTEREIEKSRDQKCVRLFACSNTTGMFKVSEIVNFTQQDLLEDDVMLLDTISEIYVWVGRGANQLERKKALQTAVQYLKSDTLGRTENDTRLIQIKQGYEPSTFTSHFHGWDHSRWRSSLYKKDNVEQQTEDEHITSVQQELEKLDQHYSYQELIQRILPDGVDSTCKEKYLTDAEFVRLFGLSKENFYSKPKWKQLELKKRVGLF